VEQLRDRPAWTPAAARVAALVLVVALALGHVHVYDRKPHGAQWRQAAEMAAAVLRPGQQIAVAPGYAANAVRYYLRNGPAADAPRPANDGDPAAAVAIIADQGVASVTAARLRHAYPHPLVHLRGLVVRHH
ncbi:MAG: hypothetical protein ACREQN_13665, partial [Candidatus Binataceae bacterium]